MRIHEKDSVGTLPTSGFIYQNGPWSYCTDEVISDVTTSGSKLMKWIPTRGVNTRNESVAHLSWIAPEEFDGSESYMDYLIGLDEIGSCDFGPSSDWQACEYTQTMYPVSFKSKPIKRTDYATLECERSPIYRLRGPNAGMPIDNDADWALARVGWQMQEHLEFVKFYGDPAAGQLMYEGLDSILSTGWVLSHKQGSGSCDFTDPLVFNGTNLNTPRAALAAIKQGVRRARKIASQRRVTITPQDMVVVMTSTHWAYIADAIAMGALTGATLTNVSLQQDVRAYFDERGRITQETAEYDGFIEIDNRPVYVIVDDLLGSTVTLSNGNPGIVGDILILVRYFGPLTVLEHQFLDWRISRMRDTNPIEEVIMQNGMLRTGYVVENNKCFYYWAEMEGRYISRMQPLQTKITDVVFEIQSEAEHFSGSFASPNFYAFNNQLGGQGNALITGL